MGMGVRVLVCAVVTLRVDVTVLMGVAVRVAAVLMTVRVVVAVLVTLRVVVFQAVLVVVPVAHGDPFRCAGVDVSASTGPLCAYERTHAPVICA